nr:MAG TPA: hypothetical protein [Bacteriophage sp.]
MIVPFGISLLINFLTHSVEALLEESSSSGNV